MVRLGLVIDLNRCIGCHTCAVICKIENNVPKGSWWNRVLTIGGSKIDTAAGSYPNVYIGYLPIACQHCDNPPCVKVCPTGATYQRNSDKTVQIDLDRCIGCRYCMAACPYNARVFNWGNMEYYVTHATGWQEDHYDGKRKVYAPQRPMGVVEKCTLCVHRIDRGLEPACVINCPARARIFGDLDDPNSKVSRLIVSRGGFVLLPELGTRPKVYYLPPLKGRQRIPPLYQATERHGGGIL